MNTQVESVMTVNEFVDGLRVNQRAVYQLAVERRLPGFKVTANLRFKRGDIDGWIAAQSAAVTPVDENNGLREGKNK